MLRSRPFKRRNDWQPNAGNRTRRHSTAFAASRRGGDGLADHHDWPAPAAGLSCPWRPKSVPTGAMLSTVPVRCP